MDLNYIRATIFLVAGLFVLLFPSKKLYNMQAKILNKLPINYKYSKNSYIVTGIIFILIAIGLFVYAFLY